MKSPVRAALAQPPSEDTRRRHAAWFTTKVRAWLPHARGEDPAKVWAEARAAQADIQLAVGAALGGLTEPESLVTLLRALEVFRFAPPGGILDDRRTAPILARLDPASVASAQLSMGFVCLGVGQLDSATERFTRAAGAADPSVRGRALTGLAAVHAHRHDVHTAFATYDRADAVLKTSGNGAAIGTARAWRGLAHVDHGSLDAGIACLTEAIQALDRAGDRIGVAIHEANLAVALHRADRTTEARSILERAVACGRSTGADWWLQPMIANLGTIFQGQGDLARAEALFAQAEARVTPTTAPHIRYSIALGLGTTAEGLGDFPRARAAYERARRMAWRMDDDESIMIAEAHLGALAARAGERVEAEACFARAYRAQVDGVRHAAHELLRAQLILAPWRDARARGDVAAVRALVKAARSVVRVHAAEVRRSVVVRRARHLLIQECDRVEAIVGAPVTEEAPTVGQLVLEPAATGIWLPDSRFVDLKRRRVGRRLITALVDARLSSPGSVVDLAAMWKAGWGDDRAKDSARRNRIYVAVATLRTLGLEGILQSASGGYRLDPDIPVRLR